MEGKLFGGIPTPGLFTLSYQPLAQARLFSIPSWATSLARIDLDLKNDLFRLLVSFTPFDDALL